MDYIEHAAGALLRNQKGRDAGLFTRQAVFADIEPTLVVTSPVARDLMPIEYTQFGMHTFPPISWTAPEGTAEVVVVIEDADVPIPFPAVHGLYYGIHPSVQTLDSVDFSKKDPKFAEKGIKFIANTMWETYSAPRPLLNHGPHRYFYQVIALKKPLTLGAKPSYKEVLSKIEKEDIVGWGEWVGVAENPGRST